MNKGTAEKINPGGAFDLHKALANWMYRYPDRKERIAVLRDELLVCYGRFPLTARNITRMLEVLEK